MSVQDKKYVIPDWTINQTLHDSRVGWAKDFDNAYLNFAEKISESIATEIFAVLKESCQDPFKLQPSEKRTLRRIYHFNIVEPKYAEKLMEMAQDASKEAPFNEWFARLAASKKENEKVVEDKANLIEDACEFSSGPTFLRKAQFVTRDQENETAIDGSYFNDRMAIIGKQVCANLNDIFGQFSAKPQNERAKISAKWLADGIDFSSLSNSPDAEVELWLEEEKGSSQPRLQLASEQAIEAQKQARRASEIKGQILQVCAFIFVIAIACGLIYMAPKKV